MKMLNEKECEKALNRIVDDSHKKYCDYKTQNAWGIISKLIKEHFDDNGNVRAITNIVIDEEKIKETVKEMVDDSINKILNPQPYKFEDLKSNMWLWDDKFKEFCKIAYIIKEKIIYTIDENGYSTNFEESRFFPITKALEYQ